MKQFNHHHRGFGRSHEHRHDHEHGHEPGLGPDFGEGPRMGRGHRLREFFASGPGGFHGRFHGEGRGPGEGMGGHGEGMGRFHGRGERRRMFEGGELKLVFLALMEAAPRHGYDLIREIETRTGGVYGPSPGIVYPTLNLLEEMGHIEVQASEGAKRQFALTESGKAFLGEHRGEADAALARLDAIGARARPMDAGPVARAMQNLKTVLGQRLSSEPDKKVLFEVADLIDEAARKIERL